MNPELRIGLGIDLHRLAPGRPCVLGGVTIPAAVGPEGHSDGDAVLHAACDAVLGAAGLDDLGTLFPETDPANRGRCSTEFCGVVLHQARGRGYRVASLDIVVETERPVLRPYRAAIRAKLAELFALPADAVNVKGKSGEALDAIGRGEALRATAIALLVANPGPG